MGRKSKYAMEQEQKDLSQKHYLQYDNLRRYVDISRDVLDDLVTLRLVKRYKPGTHSISLYCLEEIQQYISSCDML